MHGQLSGSAFGIEEQSGGGADIFTIRGAPFVGKVALHSARAHCRHEDFFKIGQSPCGTVLVEL